MRGLKSLLKIQVFRSKAQLILLQNGHFYAGEIFVIRHDMQYLLQKLSFELTEMK